MILCLWLLRGKYRESQTANRAVRGLFIMGCPSSSERVSKIEVKKWEKKRLNQKEWTKFAGN